MLSTNIRLFTADLACDEIGFPGSVHFYALSLTSAEDNSTVPVSPTTG